MISPVVRSRGERLIILIASLCIIGGGALFLGCQWSTRVGENGVFAKLSESIGVGVLGVGTVIVGIIFAKWAFQRLASKQDAPKQLAYQFCMALLSLLVYGGIFVVALGGVVALDGASAGTIVVVIAVWILCIAVFIGYRMFRKKHAVHYDAVGFIGLALFMLILGGVLLVISLVGGSDAARDLREGPRTADVFLVDATVDYPSVRYRAFVQKSHVLTFYTANDERIVLEVPENDIAAAKVINDYGNFVHLTYYPHSQIFCGATPWPNGRQAMGEDLLDELGREYDFVL